MHRSEPVYKATRSGTSSTVSQGDHVRLLVELLQPLGPELARRWVAALMMVDREDREAMVSAIERKVVENYGPHAKTPARSAESTAVAEGHAPREITLVHPPRRDSEYIERIETTYEVRAPSRRSTQIGSKAKRAR